MMLNPRQYLSWSQLDLFERSPERYKEVYIYGRQMPINRGMVLGKQMTDGLESGEMTGDPILDLVMERIPKFEIRDKILEDPRGEEVECQGKTYRVPVLKDGKIRIPILAKPDSMKAEMTGFKEYKTGQERWTAAKVRNSGQMRFYGTAMYLVSGRIPNENELVHALTAKQNPEDPQSRVIPTGDIYRYPFPLAMSDVLNMMIRMKNAWRGINEMVKEELL